MYPTGPRHLSIQTRTTSTTVMVFHGTTAIARLRNLGAIGRMNFGLMTLSDDASVVVCHIHTLIDCANNCSAAFARERTVGTHCQALEARGHGVHVYQGAG